MRLPIVVSLVSCLVLAASAAVAQPVPGTIPATMPTDPAAIAAVCASLPATPPTLAGPMRAQALNLTVRAGAAHGRGEFAAAAALYWEAFVLTNDSNQLDAIAIELDGIGVAERPRQCALLACLVPRATDDSQRAELVRRQGQAHCPTQQAPNVPVVPVGPNPPVMQNQTFVLSADELAAVQADTGLASDIRHAEQDGFLIGISHEWHVPVRFRDRVAAAVLRWQNAERVLRPVTPHRSVFGYALPITGWVAGAGLLAGGVVSALQCSEANAELERANAGLTNGWPRQAYVDAQNNCLMANILIPSGLVLIGAGTAGWFLLAPPRVTIAPTVGPTHAGLVLRLTFM